MLEAGWLRAEVDIDVPDSDLLTKWTYAWVHSAVSRLVPETLAKYESAGGSGSARSSGVPNGVRISLRLTTLDMSRTGELPWSPSNLDKFCARIGGGSHYGHCEVIRLDGSGEQHGPPTIAVGVRLSEIEPRAASLYCLLPTARVEAPTATIAMEDILALTRAMADKCNPLYGSIGYDVGEDGTVLESAFNSYGLFDDYAEVRQYLRGYDWVTVLPAEIAARLGGAESLRRSGAFVDAQDLASGGVLVRATSDFFDYSIADANQVFRTLAPCLRPGMPVVREILGVQYRRPPLVVANAAEHGTR